MKKLICILASAALLGACEQKTEVVAPEKKAEDNTTALISASADTGQKPKRKPDGTTSLSGAMAPATSAETKTDTASTAAAPITSTETKIDTSTISAAAVPATSTETKTESTTTTTSSPNP